MRAGLSPTLLTLNCDWQGDGVSDGGRVTINIAIVIVSSSSVGSILLICFALPGVTAPPGGLFFSVIFYHLFYGILSLLLLHIFTYNFR